MPIKASVETHMPKRSPKVVFDTNHIRITPLTHEELLALEPIEVARLVQSIARNSELRAQIRSKGYRNCLKRTSTFDLNQPTYLPDGLLDGCLRLLTWLQKLENQHTNTVLFKQEQERQRAKRVLKNLKGNPTFTLYLSRRQVVEDLASRGKAPSDMLELNTTELATLLDASRWCATYSDLKQNPLLAGYCQQHHLSSGLLDRLSYLQLKEIADTIDTQQNEDLLRQQLIDEVSNRYPDWRNLIQNHPLYKQAQTGPLEKLTNEQLEALLLELEALNDLNQNAGIGFDEGGNLISIQKPS